MARRSSPARIKYKAARKARRDASPLVIAKRRDWERKGKRKPKAKTSKDFAGVWLYKVDKPKERVF